MVFDIKLSFRDKRVTLFSFFFFPLSFNRIKKSRVNDVSQWHGFLFSNIQNSVQKKGNYVAGQTHPLFEGLPNSGGRAGRLRSYVDPRAHDVVGSEDLK